MRFTSYDERAGDSLASIQELLAGRERSYLTAPLSELSVNDEGKLEHGGAEYGLTEWAATRLGNKVEIPSSYVRKAPSEVVAWNFRQFLPTAQGTVQLAIENENVVVGLLGEKAVPVPSDMLVDALVSIEPSMDLHEWRLFDRGLRMRFTSHELRAEPQVGDYTEAGIDVFDYENDGGYLAVAGSALRLVCGNGMTVGDIFFKDEIKRETWRDPAAVIGVASAFYQEALNGAFRFTENLAALVDLEFELPNDSETREELLRLPMKVVKLPSKFKSSLSDALRAEDPTLYGFHNALTRLGRDAAGMEVRQAFERAGYLSVIERDGVRQALVDAQAALA